MFTRPARCRPKSTLECGDSSPLSNPCHYRQQTRCLAFADGSGGPIALRTSPLASELPLTCEALPFAGGPSGPYLSACGGQLLIVRCAHYAGGASLTTFGFVTIVPRYLLPQVMPSHSFAALTALVVRRISGYADRPMPCLCLVRTPPEGHWRAHPAAAPCRPAVTSKQTRTPFQSASAAAQWTPPSPRRSAGAAPKRRHGPFRGGEPPPWSAAARIEYPHNPRRIPPR